MVVAVFAVIAVLGAAGIAVGAVRLGHCLAAHRGMPEAGSAVGTAVGTAPGVVFFLVLTLVSLMVGSARDLEVGRKGNHAEAGALIDPYPAAGRMPADTRTQVRGHSTGSPMPRPVPEPPAP
ncbi:hypothetical protein J7E97_28630 [Streptomyces sp. ISL-66]|uniref:hypothetical protein n=1 Tax=Streptomyces sp. ISL-66 TaxID=2819186 RepID=UPI001BEC08F0|nr:hypothetical protein [Streptomyces sp. ISL-66]MBT2471726.1 hypothetical protein [Streptomyces sp. ISL-66]